MFLSDIYAYIRLDNMCMYLESVESAVNLAKPQLAVTILSRNGN